VHLVVVLHVHHPGGAELLEIAQAARLPRLLTCPCEDGAQDGGQDRDDRDDHQQLDERKATPHDLVSSQRDGL